MEKVLALYDTDTIYATRFMEYIKKRNDVEFEIKVFTKKECLEEYLHAFYVEILLLGEGLSPEEIPKENIRLILCLADCRENSEDAAYPRILRYQQVSGVWNDILSCYSRRINHITRDKIGQADIISVFSPITGISGVSFAWYLSHSLADKRKTVFLPMELFPVPGACSSSTSDHSLSEFIYYLKENNPKHNDKFKNLLKCQGKLSYLGGLTHGLDLISLNKEDAVRWLKILQQEMDFNSIVLFLGFYSEFAIEIMCQSRTTYILAEESLYGESLVKEWGRQMEFMGADMVQGKYRKLYLPGDVSLEHGYLEGMEQKNSYLKQLAIQQVTHLYGKENL